MTTDSYAGRPLVWSIAGSDAGGGAGLQADLLTLHDLGTHGATVVTAITAQNSLGVQAVQPVDVDLFRRQCESLADDLPPGAIKIGLLGSFDQVQYLVEQLPKWRRQWPGLGVVLDPVSVATSGDRLADHSLFQAIRDLLPLVDLVTPNWLELEQLTGHQLPSEASAVRAAEALVQATDTPVLIKAGHGPMQDRLRDRLITGSGRQWCFEQPRLETRHTHGTGCTLSSAWAAAWARGYALADATALANAYVQAGLRQAYATGAGAGTLARTGWPVPGVFPGVPTNNPSPPEDLRFPDIGDALGIYPVVADPILLESLLAAGASTVQLRLKDQDPDTVKPLIERAVAAGRHYNAQVFINDYWRWAIELGAYGVHLGQEDLAEADLAAIAAAGIRLGVSTHGYAELCRALTLKPSYIALGHVFPTNTKVMPSQPQGLERLQRYQELVGGQCPTVAIGGIKSHHLQAVAACGVGSVAVVTAVTDAADPVEAWQVLNRDWKNLRSEEH